LADLDERIVACKEALPFQQWTRDVARRVVAEATLIEQMVRLDDGGPWRMASVEWQRQLDAARSRVMRPTRARAEATAVSSDPSIEFGIELPADPIEALRVLQMQVRGYELPTTLLQDVCALSRAAQEYLNAEEIKPPAAPSAVRPKNMAQAIYWRDQAERAAKLVATAGWQIITRRIADRSWGVVWLKTVCPPEFGPMLDALAKALVAPIRAIQAYIDRGYSAAAWFQDQETAAKE
jgi:hypothetical protein